MKKGEGGRGRGGRAGMRHGEDEEEEGGGRKGGRKARMSHGGMIGNTGELGELL